MAFISTDKIQDFYNIIITICNVIIPATVFILIAFVSIVFESIIWVLIICCLYITSIFYGLVILEYLGVDLNALSDTFKPTYEIKDPCSVCSNNSCKRHKLLPHSTKVKIPKDFDHALEQLLEDLLQKYVCAWYSNFSTNEAFVQQLRLATATATKNITVRLLRTDVPNVVFYHLIPLILQHAQNWKTLRTKVKDVSDMSSFGNQLIDHFGCEIHPASYSRKAELNYLRGIVTAIIPHLLPAIHVSINNKVILREILANWILLPAIDAIADPDNINALITLATHHENSMYNYMDMINVPMLQCWVTIPLISKVMQNNLKPSLDEILNDPRLLYMFMQHIKETGPMNLFQFCLDIDDLSKRMLNPDMSLNAENSLYTDIQNMYATYLDPEGPEYLHLPEDISIGIRQILEKGSKKIQEMRTSRPFYQAHQEAHALLESTCLPSFHHSYQLYDLLCGQAVPSRIKQIPYTSVTSGSTNISSKIGNHFPKIDGVLRSSTIDGMPYQDIYQGEEIDYPSRPYNEIKYSDDSFHRDLTTWRISIPHIETGDNQTLYVIAVHNIAEGKSWTVLRRDQDFYVLRTRLAEFHGDKELSDSPLPSRKNPHSSCAINRQRYEDFLEKLLSKPVLRSSELLYNFLTVPNLKPYFTNYSTPDIGILYQNMAYKLRKEKGQHLDKFMSVFLASTNIKNDYTDIGIEPSSDSTINETEKKGHRDLLFGIFGNNLNLDLNFRILSSSLERSHIKSQSFRVVDAVIRLLNVPSIISRIFWIFISSSQSAKMDPYANILLYNVLAKLLNSGRAATVVKLLHAKVMDDKNHTKDSSFQINRRNYYETAKKGLYGLLPYWLMGFYKPWIEIMDFILDSLQNAPFNKHLAYVLLDQILINIFPELTV
ncbi:sorting nexin-14-like isoform X1 [Apis dorsata]|uniref:sorting nexin-14-like isoform X1 n=1 Tax=Apis dorsata TaxID=7462 RepID=UPI0003DF530C|nr:sorting nexin-14-like isoform X1 [Apis dorsata]